MRKALQQEVKDPGPSAPFISYVTVLYLLIFSGHLSHLQKRHILPSSMTLSDPDKLAQLRSPRKEKNICLPLYNEFRTKNTIHFVEVQCMFLKSSLNKISLYSIFIQGK